MNRYPGPGQPGGLRPARGMPPRPQSSSFNPRGVTPASRPTGSMPPPISTANSAANSGSQPSMADFDWGDDDDFDEEQLVQATQAAEAAASAPAIKTAPPSRPRPGYQRSPAKSSDRIPLEMRRLELAMQGRSADSAVQMHEIMPGGVLGGEIGRQKQKPPEEEVKELKAAFNSLQQQNYQNKGEATLLRRKLDEEQKRWSRIYADTQLRKEASEKEQSKKIQETSKEKDKLQSEVRMQKQELRVLEERCKALQKRLRHFEHAATQATQAVQASQMQQMSTSALNMTLSGSKRPPGKPLSALGFAAVPTVGSQASVFRPSTVQTPLKDTPAPATPAFTTPPVPVTPVTPKETAEKTAQTDKEELVTAPEDEMQKILMEKTEIFQKVAHVVRSAAAENYFKAMLVLRNVPETAEDEVIRKMNVQGFPYTLFFPENVKLAEMIRDKKSFSPNPKLLPLLPSELTDWPDVCMESIDMATSQYLLVQEDYWSAVVYTETQLARCINIMRDEKSENRMYRRKNLECFVKLLALGATLWKYYIPGLCFFWGWAEGKKLREKYLEDMRSWTTSALWVGYRKLHVELADIEIRKMSLQLLSHLAVRKALFCSPLTYFRLYHIVHDTLVRKEHQTYENLVTSLRLVTHIRRRRFHLQYFCRRKNDNTCLAYQFARLGLQLFRSEKNFLKKHDLYVEYLNLMLELRDYCTEHVNGGEDCEKLLVKEDSEEGDGTCNGVESQKPTTNTDENNSEEMDASQSKSSLRADVSGIHSFYGYEEVEEMEVEEDEVQIIDGGKSGGSFNVFKVPEVMDSTKATRTSVANTEEFRGGFEFPEANLSEDSSALTSGVRTKVRRLVAIDGFDISREYCSMEKPPEQPGGSFEAASRTPCRRLLDSVSWELSASATTPATICQCRLYFMQSFMIMTECMVHIWHHVFMKEKVEESRTKYSNNSKWRAQLDEAIDELREEKAASSQTSAASPEKQLKNSKLWKQIREDGTRSRRKITSAAVSSELGLATEILYDSFLAVVNDVKFAFGGKGTTALYAAAIRMWGYSADLNFTNSQRTCLMTLCEELDKGIEPPSSYDSNHETTASTSASSSTSSCQSATAYAQQHLKPFQENFAPRQNLDFRKLPTEELLSKVPKVVLQACLEVEGKKKQAIDSYMNQHAEEIESATASEELTLGSDSPTVSDDEDGYATHTEFVQEDSDTEDKDRTSDVFPPHQTTKPKLVLGNIPRKSNPSHKDVPDYESFCSKGLDEASTAESFFLDPEIPIEEALPKWTKEDYCRMIEQQLNQQKDTEIKRCYMTVAEAQELLKTNPQLETLPGPKISAEYMESLMANRSVPGYYALERELTVDIDSDPLPFEI